MALARSNRDELVIELLARLNDFDFPDLTTEQKLIALHTYQLCLVKNDNLDERLRANVIDRLTRLYPDRTRLVSEKVGSLLAILRAPDFVPATLDLLTNAADQREQMHYLFLLRNRREGWSMANRNIYFQTLAQSQYYLGGQGMPGFLEKIRNEAIATFVGLRARGTFVANLTTAGQRINSRFPNASL